MQFPILILDSGDEGLHGVVVLGADGIKFVIVATGTSDAETEESLTDIRHHLIERILAREPLRRLIFADLARQQYRRCDKESRRCIRAQCIANDLLFDEVVIRRVVVEGPDDVVAIWPRVGPLGVYLKTVRVRIAHHVQPMLCPALAIARRGEQSLDGGGGVGLSQEGLHFLRSGW